MTKTNKRRLLDSQSQTKINKRCTPDSQKKGQGRSRLDSKKSLSTLDKGKRAQLDSYATISTSPLLDSHGRYHKRICKCPKKVQRICRKTQLRNPKDVAEIVEALSELSDAEESTSKYYVEQPVLRRRWTPRCRPKKDRCPIPMEPDLETRLRYISHCPPFPMPKDVRHRDLQRCEFLSSDEEDEDDYCGRTSCSNNKAYQKRVQYYDMMPGDIILPAPTPIIRHGCCREPILQVPSPKTSGTNVKAEPCTLKPNCREYKPPLPGKSGHSLFQPHSGIVVNQDADYVPDVAAMGGSEKPRRRKCIVCRRVGNKGPCSHAKGMSKRGRRALRERMKKKKAAAKRRALMAGPVDPYCTVGGAMSRASRGSMPPKRDPDVDPCGLDDIPKQDHPYIPPNLKRGMFRTHSLTVMPCTKERRIVHYGILTGAFNMYDAKFGPKSRGKQALVMSVMAYCLAFHYHPKQWTTKLVDNLIDAGDQWYLQCADRVHDHSAVQGMCEVLPFSKKHVLNLNGKKMQVLLSDPEIVGYTLSQDPTVYNLCRGLKAFFKENRAGVLLTRVLKVSIWKDKVCFYIFDPAGRDARAIANYTNGAAALINVKDVESVAEAILARTSVEDQKFVLAPMKVLKMIDEKADEDIESDRELTQAEKTMLGFKILNESCAIVNATMNLGAKCFEHAKNRQSLPIAVMAMTYAKISPPNTWYSKTLDKILRLGSKLFIDSMQPRVLLDITIDNIPHEIIVGPYACEIIIYRERVKGQIFSTKECVLNIQTGLKEFFSNEYNSGILEFHNYILAIWRQKEMFYIFDPYPRTPDGRHSLKSGNACCLMLLNTDAMADVIKKNFEPLPVTTLFYIHAFKVLKLKKTAPKKQIICCLSDEMLPTCPGRKSQPPPTPRVCVGRMGVMGGGPSTGGGEPTHGGHVGYMASDTSITDINPARKMIDEEKMGDIVSLIDSIQEEYLQPIPRKYKIPEEEAYLPKMANLDSPTVSVTQIVPPWPKPRDKTDEPPEPDPEREPTPPPTPPPPPPPEGEEEAEDEEEIERKKKEEREKKKKEEEERKKAEQLPPPLPPPPPTPQQEPELAKDSNQPPQAEVETIQPVTVTRTLLLAEDAKRRSKLRAQRKNMSLPLQEECMREITPDEELDSPSNFKELPDGTQIIKANNCIKGSNANDVLPFASIVAIVMSYKYLISTWGHQIVNYIVDVARELHKRKQDRFQMAPIHVIPKIAIGSQAYKTSIDVIADGPTWRLGEILQTRFFDRYDRGMLTTCNYSCAIFKKNGLYYLFDGSCCNPMGLRNISCLDSGPGHSCFMRFKNPHDLIARIQYNKGGPTEDQQFIISKVIVRRLSEEPRMQMPDDYDYEAMEYASRKRPTKIRGDRREDLVPCRSDAPVGYLPVGSGRYRIEGTTSLVKGGGSPNVKACHFACLVAMLMACMHPIRNWDHIMVDYCLEKGLEIYDKAANLSTCDRRVIRNLLVDGKIMHVNIKRLLVINENTEKTMDQYVRAVLRRLRYVIIRFPPCSMLVCRADGYYHVFDPYGAPPESGSETPCGSGSRVGSRQGSQPSTRAPSQTSLQRDSKTELTKKEKKELKESKVKPIDSKSKSDCKPQEKEKKKVKEEKLASWTLYPCVDAVLERLRRTVGEVKEPEFYTFELTSVKTAPRHAGMSFRLSPLFRPEENPNARYMTRRPERPAVSEKMEWLNIPYVPWSRGLPCNDASLPRRTPRTMWRQWDIEFPGDLVSLWGRKHPTDPEFPQDSRGLQYLSTSVVALAMVKAVDLSAWTPRLLDGIVVAGDRYCQRNLDAIGCTRNVELTPEKLVPSFDMYPYNFKVKFNKVIYGFVYNHCPDRFNLSKALSYFFEKHNMGLFVSPMKNFAFGRTIQGSYFMFDCQSFGAPIHVPGSGSAYILKCESLNRLIYCMTITLNVRRHGQQFHLYCAEITLGEKRD